MGKKIQITESQLDYIIKNANRIDEQTASTEDYGKYAFGGAFANNYITPDTSSTSYQNTLKKMQADLKKAVSEGKKLSEFKIIIKSSASAMPATNGYTLSSPPNHNFVAVGKTDGGLLSGGKWVVKGSDGWKNVADNQQVNANTFLAQNRGIGMKNALVKDLNSMGFGDASKVIQLEKRKDGKWVAASKDPSEQYVNVVIDGLLTPPPPQSPSKYSIIYDWYQIGGKDTPYVLIDGENSKYVKELQHSQWGRGMKKLRQSFVDAVKATKSVSVAGYTKTKGVGNGVGEVEFYTFGTFNGFSSRKGSTFYYTDEKSWLTDVNKINMMNPAEKTIVNGLDGIYAKGVYVKGSRGSADFHHGSGTDIAFNKLYLIKPEGVNEPVKAIQIKRTESGGNDTQPTAKPSL